MAEPQRLLRATSWTRVRISVGAGTGTFTVATARTENPAHGFDITDLDEPLELDIEPGGELWVWTDASGGEFRQSIEAIPLVMEILP